MPVSQPRGRVSPAQWPRGWSRTRASHRGAWPCRMVRSGLGSSRCGLWGCVHSRSASVAWASSLSAAPSAPTLLWSWLSKDSNGGPRTVWGGHLQATSARPLQPLHTWSRCWLEKPPWGGACGLWAGGGGGLLPQGSRSLAPSARPLPWFIKPQFVSSTRVTADRLFERIVFTGFQDKSA